MANPMSTKMIFQVQSQGSILDPLLFILYTHNMWFRLENMLVSYADDASILSLYSIPKFHQEQLKEK